MITVSAPGKIHLLGEHMVVYGKPALLTTVDLRVTITLKPPSSIKPPTHIDTFVHIYDTLRKTIESIIKKYLKTKSIPPYHLTISSQIPIGAGLGSSAAISAAYIAALLSFLKVKWDLNLIDRLTFETEKIFHGNPSGGDNTAVVHGGLISYIKGKLVQPLPFSIPPKLAKNFILINTGKPKETTKEMVEIVSIKRKAERVKFEKIFDSQEQLVKKLLLAIQSGNENQLIQIIRDGEKNLESIGVVSPSAKSIIRKIEQAGGAAKICGAGGKIKATGILLAYHPRKAVLEKIAKAENLPYFSTTLGVEGVKIEKA